MFFRIITLTAAAVLAPAASLPAQEGGAYLGVSVQPDENGVRILSVRPDTAADRAGLKDGDVIVALEEVEIRSPEDLLKALGAHEPGDRVVMKIRRGEETIHARVDLGSRAGAAGTAPRAARAAPAEPRGASTDRTAPQPDERRATLGVLIEQAEDGVRLTEVMPGGPADQGGLRAGDVLIRLAEKDISSIDDLAAALGSSKPGSRVEVRARRGEDTRTHTVRLGGPEDLERLLRAREQDEAREERTPAIITEEWTQPTEPVERSEEDAVEFDEERAYLGVMVDETTGGGATIAQVLPGSPAERGGLREGDSIVAIGDREVKSADDLYAAMTGKKPGDEVHVTAARDGDRVHVKIRLGSARGMRELVARGVATDEEPAEDVFVEVEPVEEVEEQAPSEEPGWLGVYIGEHEHGAAVTGVVPGSPAERAGVQAGDVIGRVGEDTIESAGELVERISKAGAGTRVALRVIRGDRELDLTATLGSRPEDPLEGSVIVERGQGVTEPAPRKAILVSPGGVEIGRTEDSAVVWDDGTHGLEQVAGEDGEIVLRSDGGQEIRLRVQASADDDSDEEEHEESAAQRARDIERTLKALEKVRERLEEARQRALDARRRIGERAGADGGLRDRIARAFARYRAHRAAGGEKRRAAVGRWLERDREGAVVILVLRGGGDRAKSSLRILRLGDPRRDSCCCCCCCRRDGGGGGVWVMRRDDGADVHAILEALELPDVDGDLHHRGGHDAHGPAEEHSRHKDGKKAKKGSTD